MPVVDPRRFVLGLTLVASLTGPSCGREPAKQASAPADSTQHLRQRIVVLEAGRSLGGDELVRALRHPDPKVRRAGAMALGRIQAPEALEPLLPLLADPDSMVAEQATFALGQLQGLDEKQQSTLQAALVTRLDEVPREQAATLVEALGKQGGPGTVPILRDQMATGVMSHFATRSRPPRGEGLAALGLARLGTDRALDALTQVQTLQVRESDSAWRLAAALGAHPDPRFVPILVTGLANKDAYSRAAAARALGKQGDPGTITQLLNAVTDPDWEVRTSVLLALGDLGENHAEAQSFCAALAADRHPLVREAALGSLERIGVGSHQKLVREALRDPVPAVRLAAVRALARSQKAAALEDWKRARQDSVDFVRAEALHLTRLVYGDEEAVAQLATGLRDPSPRERLHAAASLGELELPPDAPALRQARRALETTLQDQDFAVAATAAEALGKLASQESVPVLEAAYAARWSTRNDVDVRLAALQALIPLAKPGSNIGTSLQAFFQHALSDPDPRITHTANTGLAALEGKPEPVRTPHLAPHVRVDDDSLPPIDLGLVLVRLVTRHGDAVLELNGDDYPRTVANFLKLVDHGFYETGVFHRVVPAFVVQGGCPRGDGWGDAGSFLPCEYGDLRYDTEGIVGMAHAGKDTGGSQFFITHLPVPRLDGRYTAFGRVLQGMEVVDFIVRGDTFRLERLESNSKPSS